MFLSLHLLLVCHMCRSWWPRQNLPCGPSLAPLRFHLGDFVAGMPEDLLRCPVRAFSEYLDRTSGIVNRPRRLFVSSKCPSRAMSKNKISYMLRAFIIQSSASSRSGQVPRAPALETLLHRLPFSVTGLFGALWRWHRDVRTRFLHRFICGVYPLLQMEFTL